MPDRALPLYWATGLVGLAGGFAASKVGWPLPWMVGSLLAIIAVRCLSPWQLPEIPNGRRCGQCIIGLGIGLHFTPQVIEQVGTAPPRSLPACQAAPVKWSTSVRAMARY